VPEAEAIGPVADMYGAERAGHDYLPNYAAIFSHRPAAYEGWRLLNRAIRGNMDPRRYELATVAAARRIRSTYCSLAHGAVLEDGFLTSDALRALVADHRAAGLDEIDVAIMDLAEKVAGDATSVTQSDVDRLRDLGLTDGEIFDVVAAAAARCFFSKVLDGLGVEADAAYSRRFDPKLLETLTLGRPIEGR
jgi:uncharacterized peroxidase-related enzyme